MLYQTKACFCWETNPYSGAGLFRDGMFAVPLCEPDRLARSLAQVIKFCTPGFAASYRSDIDDIRRMKREDSFHALVIDDSADREIFVNAPAFAGNHRAGKYLRAFFIAFPDPAVNIHYITYLEVRDILF
jgi:hypothetical protein